MMNTKNRIGLGAYLYVFLLLVYAGKATVFARELADPRTIGFLVGFSATIIVAIRNKVQIRGDYLLLVGVFLLYCAITTIIYHGHYIFFMTATVIQLTIGYIVIKAYRERFLFIYEKLIYILCIISLACWFMESVAPALFYTLTKPIAFSQPYSNEFCNVSYNFIVYTVGSGVFGTDSLYTFLRNPGFCWEPGAFAVYICLAIFINIMRYNLKIKKNPKLLVYAVTLFTTGSTTGIVIFSMMLLLWLLFSKQSLLRKMVYSLPIIIIIVFLISQSFVSDKLLNRYENLEGISKMERYNAEKSQFIVMDRFDALLIQFDEFRRHPFLGIGMAPETSFIRQMGLEGSLISGMGSLLVDYGLLIFLWFFYNVKRSSDRFRTLFSTRNAYLLIVPITGMLISYTLYLTPVIVFFWLFGYCIRPNQITFQQ